VRRFAHGLVVGKFYPPHLGHLRLVESAANSCDQVTVVVAANSEESLRLAERVEWLSWATASSPNVRTVGVMDDHPIDYDDAQIWDAHMAVFTGAVAEVSRVPVDAVFSAEDYGDELARRLGATHVRRPRDISATEVRADLFGSWASVVPAARTGLARRIVVVGAESTGTTTLAHQLAARLAAEFVPEYGRTYTAGKLAAARQTAHEEGRRAPWLDELEWTSDEFTLIACRQTAAIAEAAERSPVVVADTDALATSVWHDRYVGGPHEPSLLLSRNSAPDLYLLTSTDGAPFTQDGLRDGEEIRDQMNAAFGQALDASKVRWVALAGTETQRLADAERVCVAVISSPHFTDPG
jgi:NadR type nicotinamide-nucleotide adenylyltransferase